MSVRQISSVPITAVEDYLPVTCYRTSVNLSSSATHTGSALPLTILSLATSVSASPDATQTKQGLCGPGYRKLNHEEIYNRDIDELRRMVSALKKETRKLEATRVLVKRSIEIVARKRAIAQRKRQRQSDWDWCDGSDTDASDAYSDWEWIE